ncbi:uncharacterized protein LOC111907170 [Lactuca sativa]|uniref:uncharacterized protein LOC111907170 n=1 Tax=Lactuca sativa TaxID=4236 RepID=UPI0022AFC731|nr:uncharacterized protein LOC111907170 [Lactuca sativa]
MGSAIIINPPAAKDLHLDNWYNENEGELEQLLNRKTYNESDLLFPIPQKNDTVPIATAIESLKSQKPVWIKGSLSLLHQHRSFSNTSCANCQKLIEADVNWIIICPFCYTESEVQLISRATVQIDDATGSLSATISKPDLEKFIPFTPEELKYAEDNEKSVHDTIATSVDSVLLFAFVCSQKTCHQQEPSTTYNIVKAYNITPAKKPK